MTGIMDFTSGQRVWKTYIRSKCQHLSHLVPVQNILLEAMMATIKTGALENSLKQVSKN